MRILYVCFLLTICACAKKDNVSHDDVSPSQKLYDKYQFYLAEAAKAADSYGFVGGSHCDSLLFTGLAAHAGLKVDIYQAEKSAGEWQRHPAFDCYPGDSDSTISKDMFAGLLIYLAKDPSGPGAAKRILSYGAAHNYFMGAAKDNATALSKTLLSLGLINSFKKLAGMSLTEQKSHDSVGVQNGFLGHLDVLHIYSVGLLFGGISDSDLSLAQAYCDHSPRNALYCAVYHRFSDGAYDAPLSVLLDETLFPADRLPGSLDRCEPYLWQREENDSSGDWSPCPSENKTHQGIDFLIAAKLILGEP